MKKRLIIIDANSLIHRAFHALPELTTAKGQMVNALYGFLLVFFKVIKEFKPDYIAACFDAPGPTKRGRQFAAYKAKRAKAPNELYDQIPLVKEALAAFGVPAFEQQGLEADDLIATIARIAPQKQAHPPLETIIVSGDMDTLQLVDDKTKVFTMRKGLQDTVLYDTAAVQKRFGGLLPEQLRDYKGLRGDPSDNIPGVTGIGDKTAIDLLSRFQSMENLYESEALKEIKPRTQALLVQYKDQALLSRDLATLDRNAPIDFSISNVSWSGLNTAKARELLERYEFRTLLGRVGENNSGNDVMSRIEKMYKEGVFSRTIYELEKDLVPVVASMEKAGIAIDPSRFTALGADIQKELEGIEKDVFRMVGTAFNLQSPRQLSEILFVKLDISPKGLHKTPGGVVSTASPELQKLKETHPVVAKVLKWRELAKLLNTYVEPLPAMADQNNRIHAHFDQLGAATGRMSSSEPNLQNIPMQGDWAKKIRKGFIAQEGRKFVACDYSQMELRIIAHLAKEPKMQRVFREGRDIHALTAAEIFGVPADKVTPQLRYRAKALNFGIIYGMGARGFAESAGVSLGEAEDFIENYFLRFPKIHEYMEATKEFAHKNGYVQTMWGRKRYLPDIDSSTPRIRAAAERAAINHPVQGSAADIIKKAMVEVFKTFSSQEGVRMILQLHDELLFEIKSEMIALCLGPIRHAMETACRLDIPLVVEASTGTSWGDMIPMVQ